MPLINADDLDITPPDFLVEGLFPRVGVGFVYGPSYYGKSLVIGQELGLAVANGTPFLGRATIRGMVAYCLGEGLYDAGVRKQARLIREQHDRMARAAEIARRDGQAAADAWLAAQPPYTDVRLKFMTEAFAVPVSPQMEPTRALRRAATEMGQLPDLELVILDSAADFGGLSLANDTSANRFMLGMKWLSAQLDCLVIAIAHPNGGRGNEPQRLPGSRLFASSDFVFGIEPDLESTDGSRSATVIAEKVKCGPLPDSFAYTIEPIGWHQPDTDPETGEPLPDAPPIWVTSATVRLRADDQASTGGLRLPGETDAAPPALPAAEPIPQRPRKRNGIRQRPRHGQFTTGTEQEQDAAERAELTGTLLAAPCPDCPATPGSSCDPMAENASPPVLIGKHPLVVVHAARMSAAVASGAVTGEDVLAQFKPGTVPAELDSLAPATAEPVTLPAAPLAHGSSLPTVAMMAATAPR